MCYLGLPLGECTVTVSATGLEQKRVDNATLTVGETRTLDVELGVIRAAGTRNRERLDGRPR